MTFPSFSYPPVTKRLGTFGDYLNLLFHHQNGAGGLADDPFDHGAHEEFAQAGAAVAPQDDEVHLLGPGPVDNGLVGLPPGHRGFQRHPAPPGFRLQLLHHRPGGAELAVGGGHGNPQEMAAHPLGDAQGLLPGRGAEGRVVAGHQQALELQGRTFRDHQNVDPAMANDPGGDAAHEEPGQAGQAVAAHDDPVGLEFLCLFPDAFKGGGTAA